MKTNMVQCHWCPTQIDTYNDCFESGTLEDGNEYYSCKNCMGD